MTISDTVISIAAPVLVTILGSIAKSLKKIVEEFKAVSLIVRMCPGCQDTKQKIDQAQEHL